jgi:hypothetical protein
MQAATDQDRAARAQKVNELIRSRSPSIRCARMSMSADVGSATGGRPCPLRCGEERAHQSLREALQDADARIETITTEPRRPPVLTTPYAGAVRPPLPRGDGRCPAPAANVLLLRTFPESRSRMSSIAQDVGLFPGGQAAASPAAFRPRTWH